MDIYDLTVPQLSRTLKNLDSWLTRAAAHERGDQLLAARLAPDQFTLGRQVQVATDNAKLMVARLAGKEWPSHPDTETTIPELRARIASITGFVEAFGRDDFTEARERKITLPWMSPGQWMLGYEYLVEFALPNYYFHVVTAYAILRHEGVPLGKQDFLGQITIRA